MIKVTIVDDHPLVVNGLKNIISAHKDLEVISTYNNGSDLMEGLKHQVPDVLLLDIQMPGLQGDVICKNITRLYPHIRIIAITNLDTVFYIQTLFKSGALGYVLKTAKEETIVTAVRKVYANEQFLEPELQKAVLQSSLVGTLPTSDKTLLTEREKEVLQLISENNTSKEIAEKLFLSKRTIDHHRNNLLLKLNVKNTAALIKKAISLDLLT